MGAAIVGGFVLALLAVTPQVNTGLIVGILADPTGRPLPGAVVTIASDDVQVRSVVTDEAGRYRFEDLPPARYGLEARMSGFLTRPAVINLAAGEVVRWGGALLVGSAPDNRSVEHRVLRVIGPDAIDCGRHLAASTDSAALQRSLDCAVAAAQVHQPFSLIVQHSVRGESMFEGLVAASDGGLHRFTYGRIGDDLEMSSCPHPALSDPRGHSWQPLRIRCEADPRVLSVADLSR